MKMNICLENKISKIIKKNIDKLKTLKTLK
jgi:hypothetical protein